MFAKARNVQFVRYLWVIPVLSLLVILSYFYFDGPSPDAKDMQVISLGALQTVMRREVEKILDNVIVPQANSKVFPIIRQRPDSEKLRILVTGGAGFVGSHLVDRLMMDGHYVIVLDNYFTGSPNNLEQWVGHRNYQFIRHDIIEPISLEVDQIYHLACPASPVHYRVDPIKTIMTNTRGTIHMLGLAKRVNARMLLASSSDVYGDPPPENHPQKETFWGYVNPDGPRACYDEGKRVAETMMYAYESQAKVDVRVARIFNTYGPRMHPDDGRVISNFITQALQDKDITIQGTGTQTRSFQYIDDLVEGLIKLMNGDYSQPVNLGNPQEMTIKDIADKVLNVVKTSTSTIKYLPGTVDDPTRRKPDVSLAAEKIGWRPTIDIDEGLHRTVEYFRKEVQPQPTELFKQKEK